MRFFAIKGDDTLTGGVQTMFEIILLLSALFAAAVIGAQLVQLVRIPRVVGYLAIGIMSRYVVLWLSDGVLPHETTWLAFQEIISLGLCLILFSIGVEFDATHIRHLRKHIWKLSLAETVVVIVLVFLATWAAGRLGNNVSAIFLAIAATATAPGATLLVLRQYDSKGPLTDHILAMTALNNIVCIVLFYVAFGIFSAMGLVHAERMEHGLVWGILLVTAISAGLGFFLGLLLSTLNSFLNRSEMVLSFIAILLAVSALSKSLGTSMLIVSMFMGVTFANFTIQPHAFRQDVVFLSMPLLVLFFVLAGFKLDLTHLAHLGWVGVAYVLARTIGKIGGAAWGVRWIGPQYHVPETFGTALLCQAGVVIGLGTHLFNHWGWTVDGVWQPSPEAQEVNTVILAAVTLFELVGPVLTKRATVQAGEVKAISLLERRGGSFHEVSTVLSRLRGMLISRSRGSAVIMDNMMHTTRDLMRTNVETLNQTSGMVEVLHFVERSRLNQFYVLDAERRFVGRIDFRDLRNLLFNPMLAKVANAFDMANTNAPVALADQTLDSVFELFQKHNVDSLPVVNDVDERRFLGVIEQRDVLRALHRKSNDHTNGPAF